MKKDKEKYIEQSHIYQKIRLSNRQNLKKKQNTKKISIITYLVIRAYLLRVNSNNRLIPTCIKYCYKKKAN